MKKEKILRWLTREINFARRKEGAYGDKARARTIAIMFESLKEKIEKGIFD